jgi:hypothetical protein
MERKIVGTNRWGAEKNQVSFNVFLLRILKLLSLYYHQSSNSVNTDHSDGTKMERKRDA